MPAEALWLEVGKRRSAIALGELLALKRVFGVSIQALTHRCRDLDIIGVATHRALFNEFDRLGWRSPPYEEYGRNVRRTTVSLPTPLSSRLGRRRHRRVESGRASGCAPFRRRPVHERHSACGRVTHVPSSRRVRLVCANRPRTRVPLCRGVRATSRVLRPGSAVSP